MECPQCKKNNDTEANFCARCGFSLSSIKKKTCAICLEEKKLEVLICGHLCCSECINTQYQIKRECPTCRAPIKKCLACNSFRVHLDARIEKCLDCLDTIKVVDLDDNYADRNRCIECSSKRLLYNHVNDSWKCLDCFRNFTIENGQARVAQNLSSTTTICLKCCSNELEMNSQMEYRCLNCLNDNVEVKIISLEEFSVLRVKSKEEVNIQTKKCANCLTDKIIKLLSPNGYEYYYYCYTCNQQHVKVI